MSEISSFPNSNIDNRLQIIEEKLDRVLQALNIEDGYSSSNVGRRIMKRRLGSSDAVRSEDCDAEDSGPTTDRSEEMSEASKYCHIRLQICTQLVQDIFINRTRMIQPKSSRNAKEFKRFAGD